MHIAALFFVAVFTLPATAEETPNPFEYLQAPPYFDSKDNSLPTEVEFLGKDQQRILPGRCYWKNTAITAAMLVGIRDAGVFKFFVGWSLDKDLTLFDRIAGDSTYQKVPNVASYGAAIAHRKSYGSDSEEIGFRIQKYAEAAYPYIAKILLLKDSPDAVGAACYFSPQLTVRVQYQPPKTYSFAPRNIPVIGDPRTYPPYYSNRNIPVIGDPRTYPPLGK